jgi:hypothetical protein
MRHLVYALIFGMLSLATAFHAEARGGRGAVSGGKPIIGIVTGGEKCAVVGEATAPQLALSLKEWCPTGKLIGGPSPVCVLN